MAATPSTTAEKVTPLAMYAVAQFMLDRRLPAPIALRAPSVCPSAIKAVTIDVYAADFDTWTDATDAEYVGTETTRIDGERFALVTMAGRVPSAMGDVAVRVRIAQRVDDPRPALSLVGGETA